MKSFLFPGRGAGKIGMGEGLFEAFPGLIGHADTLAALCRGEDSLDRRFTRMQMSGRSDESAAGE